MCEIQNYCFDTTQHYSALIIGNDYSINIYHFKQHEGIINTTLAR